MSQTTFSKAFEGWLAFFDSRHIEMRKQLNPPATREQISAAESELGVRLPDDVCALYLVANGQLSPFKVTRTPGQQNVIELPFEIAVGQKVGNLFGSYEFSSLEIVINNWNGNKQIRDSPGYADDGFDENVEVREGDCVKKEYLNNRWIPIGTDGGGNFYAVDLDPPEGGTVGQIIVLGPDEDFRRVLADSLTSLFEESTKRASDFNENEQRVFFSIEA